MFNGIDLGKTKPTNQSNKQPKPNKWIKPEHTQETDPCSAETSALAVIAVIAFFKQTNKELWY